MATRSLIGFIEQGDIVASYCHYDGYLEWNGKILLEHYNDYASAKELVLGGAMRSIDFNKQIDYFEPYEAPNTFPYAKNSKELEKNYLNKGSEPPYTDIEFIYYHDGQKWLYREVTPNFSDDSVTFGEEKILLNAVSLDKKTQGTLFQQFRGLPLYKKIKNKKN